MIRLSKIFHFFSVLFILLTVSCSNKEEINITSNDFHLAVDLATNVMVHDIFSPPVASRVYVYPNIAAYEIISNSSDNFNSLKTFIKDFPDIPLPESENVNLRLAALISHLELTRQLVFSEQLILEYSDSLYLKFKKTNKTEFKESQKYALSVVEVISNWMNNDNYNETRTMSKFMVDPYKIERWQPTPPSYMDGVEPHWNKIRTLVLDSLSQFKPKPPPKYSLEENSKFYNELIEVYDLTNKITELGDESEEIAIAQFWDCNPYVSVTRGHMMFATKKISPGAHWIGITKIASNMSEKNFEETIYSYTKVSIGIFDAFISNWDEKYRSNLVRPETLINTFFDSEWKPILQTPPFPEYTSGHSVISTVSAEILTNIFGDNFLFADNTEVAYGLPVRNFKSFNHAAKEAAISRLYGGIHYRSAIEEGVNQGKKIAYFIINNLKLKNE
ncbi:MAG: vanadium-dependent haloperoxidase [Cryomorphaceae bacterium]|nr:vanadium-dependent haloperoxidase [Cryomorphaceae bacterium]